MLRREFPYLEITIEEYCNEFIEKYRNDKNFNKLIRSNVFTPDYMRRGCRDFNSNTRCKGQITYVKFNDNNLICNIKVCGVIGKRYYSDDVINLSVNKKSTGKSYLGSEGVKYYNNNNNIRRNDLIRDLFKPEIIDFLRLFGFNSSKMDFVKIGKIKTVDSIKVSS